MENKVLKVEDLVYHYEVMVSLRDASQFMKKCGEFINQNTGTLELSFDDFSKIKGYGVSYIKGYVQIPHSAYVDFAIKKVKSKAKDYLNWSIFRTSEDEDYWYMSAPFSAYKCMEDAGLKPLMTNIKMVIIYNKCHNIDYIIIDDKGNAVGEGNFNEFGWS